MGSRPMSISFTMVLSRCSSWPVARDRSQGVDEQVATMNRSIACAKGWSPACG